MRKELEKSYNPDIEDRIYKNWEEKKYFHAKIDKDKKPYTIVMPPPNITGKLHMGHALNNSLQDCLIRAKRMQGYSALWIPGTDHAAIATEVKIVEAMAEEGLTKEELGRENFLERAWDWKRVYGGEIINQLKKLGCSCDWDRESFTMDDDLSRAVLHVFVKLYKKDYIYRGERLINWCPECKTSISDAEVDHKDINAKLYYLKYPIIGSDEFLTFATTRPETILGDTAIAVNPADERYLHLIGKKVRIPIIDREIPIIADEYVEKDFGSGVVKITPAHDPNDFEVGLRHKLPIINVINDDGTINENGGIYQGLERFAAREEILNDFKKQNLFVKIEDLNHSVGVHGRCGTVVEPLIRMQWFVKMEQMGKRALDAYLNKELKFVPEHYAKIYVNWLENIKDWCISRQLWWGHRIPAYYCEKCGHINVSESAPEFCEKCNHTGLKQDEDTLDTWFSSALWPFSTLGWPEKTPDYDYFFPTDVLVTAYDIIFFWVIRMVFSSLEQTDKLPFKDVLINGIVRDDKGQKMSKSKGNGIDPLDIIDKFGSDALRLTLMSGNAAGSDMRFSYEKLESDRAFLNKIWNATRFVMMNFDENEPKAGQLMAEDKWILSRVNSLAKKVTENIDSYELGLALQNVYEFIWGEYCDWYIEMVKPRLYNKDDTSRESALYTLKEVLIRALKLLHPFLPFITEEIFTTIQSDEETILLSKWPVFEESLNFSAEENEIEIIKAAIKSIRNIRAEMNVLPSKKSNIFIVSQNEYIRNVFEKGKLFLKTLAHGNDVIIQSDNTGIGDDAVSAIIQDGVIYLPFAELIDFEKEIARLEKEKDKLMKEVERVEKKLGNEGFVAKAPPALIQEEKEKAEKYKNMLLQADAQLNKIKRK